MKPRMSSASRFIEISPKECWDYDKKAYHERILKKYNTDKCSASPASIVKGGKFVIFQCPRNQNVTDKMKLVPYVVVRSIMYAQVYAHSDLAFVIKMLA